jgi:hypothetical protein
MPTTYSEQLRVPLRWWAQATMALAAVWLAFIVSTPEWIAWTATGVLLLAVYGLFAWIGSSRLEVRDGVLYAGPAHIELALIGPVDALDKEATRLVHGRDADARAFLHTRPYVSRAVKITIDDPADPTPYWLVSSRHPRRLAAALNTHDNAR